MAFTFNGFGVRSCGNYAPIKWTKRKWFTIGEKGDHDAINCMVVVFLPILTVEPQHTFDWQEKGIGPGIGYEYQKVKLKWNWRLVVHTFLRPWSIAFIAFGTIGLLIWYSTKSLEDFLVGCGLIIFGILGFIVARSLYRRCRDIRLLLGRHALGTSDPATWEKSIIDRINSSEKLYGTKNFEEACRKFISSLDWENAMWAARYCTAVENKYIGGTRKWRGQYPI